MNEKKIVIAMILGTIVLLFGGIFFLSKTTATPQITASQNAKAAVVGTSFDWGNIPMYKGLAVKSFIIKNSGTDTLKLFNIKTSCHCTKAYATINGVDGPRFGMADLSSWVGIVAPGGEAKITAEFDPAYHGPQGVGSINRFVSVETNDEDNSKITFTLTGNVVK